MDVSGKWVKALIGFKKHEKVDDHDRREKMNGNSKKWRPWKSSSRNHGGSSSLRGCKGPNSSSVNNDALVAAMATMVKAPPKDFQAVRQHWAAITIQTAFRAFLARRALKALRGLVRLQAIVRGWKVRKQAAITLKCMQAMLLAQARVRAQRLSMEDRVVQKMLEEPEEDNHMKRAEVRWCDSKGTYEEVKAKIQMRQGGAFKREGALAYSLVKEVSSKSSDTQRTVSKTDKNSSGWSWLERWMAARPWETRSIEQAVSGYIQTTLKSSETLTANVRKNNVTKRISANPQTSSCPNSELQCDVSSASSFLCTSTTPGNGLLGSDSSEERKKKQQPNYMTLIESSKAKVRNHRIMRQSMGMEEFNGDSKSNAGSDCSWLKMDKSSKTREQRELLL